MESYQKFVIDVFVFSKSASTPLTGKERKEGSNRLKIELMTSRTNQVTLSHDKNNNKPALRLLELQIEALDVACGICTRQQRSIITKEYMLTLIILLF